MRWRVRLNLGALFGGSVMEINQQLKFLLNCLQFGLDVRELGLYLIDLSFKSALMANNVVKYAGSC